MRFVSKSLITIVVASVLTIALPAQQSSTDNQQSSTDNHQQNQSMGGMQGVQGMQSGQMQHGNMDQMMQNCRKTMQPMMQTNSQAKKDIEAARTSNDPAKMRSALDEAEKAIDDSGMMGGQQSQPESQKPPKQ